MKKKLINEELHRGCKIIFFEQWDEHDFDGVNYSFEVVDRQGAKNTYQSDEYPFGSLDWASLKATESIDYELDDWHAVSCLATKEPGEYNHFALTFYGEKEDAIKHGMKELEIRYPGWNHSVLF